MYYVYQITNLVNNKIYVGRRKHVLPNQDSYMGSGTQIKNAIRKYGLENFRKDIVQIFESEAECAKLEASIVTKEFCQRFDTYNMHEGGFGGFTHINNDSVKRAEVSKRSSEHNKKFGIGGTKNWTEQSWKKVHNTSWGQLVKLGIINPNTWAMLSSDENRKRRELISNKVSGEGNGSYGTKIYIDENYNGRLPHVSILNKQRYIPGKQPQGWIPVTEWRDNKKNKKSNSYGKHWYNNGTENYYCYETDERINNLQLVRGRLNCKFTKNSLSKDSKAGEY